MQFFSFSFVYLSPDSDESSYYNFINPLKLSPMELNDLLRAGTNVSVTVSLEDLKQLFTEVAGNIPTAETLSPAEEY